ncbi:hypothetical protein GOBAR_DD30759 [Gossypium barbadense]|nr:hypothetical protein GOBAR_DD30759 [Gossypium barbadense]
MAMPCIGTPVIFKKLVVPLTGTNVTLLFALLFVAMSLLPLVFSWSAVEMPAYGFATSNLGFCLHAKCGKCLMSEDMAKDGYEDIMNIDISSVAIDMMRRKYEFVPQLKYMQMDVRDMSFFPDESFDSVMDKVWHRCSNKCFSDVRRSEQKPMLSYPCMQWGVKHNGDVYQGDSDRLLKPGGTYMLITYGDPSARMPHLNRPVYGWNIFLYNLPRPDFKRPGGCSSTKSYLEPIPITEKGLLPADFVLEDPDSHFIYVCKKMDDTELRNMPTYPLTSEIL